MVRLLTLALGLLVATPALACGGKCADDCAGKSAAKVESPKVDEAVGARLTLNVTGMKCGSCSAKVTAALLGVDGVTAATVDHATGTATVVYDAARTNAEALVKVVTDLNYQASVKPSAS